jgi:bifunctional non-homologous end joining protein LigD
MPLDWEEVKPGLNPTAFAIKNIPARIKEKGELFKGVLGRAIALEQCREKRGREINY